MRSFVKIKSSGNAEITLSFTNIHKIMALSRIFSVTNMCFNAICENKTLAKISESGNVLNPLSQDGPL